MSLLGTNKKSPIIKMNLTGKILCVAVVFGYTCGLHGQEVMTLKDCMQYAVGNSVRMKIQQMDVDDARVARRDTILRVFTPEVSAGTYAYSNFGRSVDPETNTYVSTTSFNNGYQVAPTSPFSTDSLP